MTVVLQSHTVQLSAGILLKPYRRKLIGLQLQSATAFPWEDPVEPAQAKQYLAHIQHHIQEAFDEHEYCMYDARLYRGLLTVTGVRRIFAGPVTHADARSVLANSQTH